jgi:N-acetylated-alpha-linked acidic dipeptidase
MIIRQALRRKLIASAAMASVLVMNLTVFAQAPMTGYSVKAAEAERQIEDRLAHLPSPDEARKHHRFLTAEPHPAGSPRNNELARHIADLWQQQGWEDVRLHRYDVLSSYPREVAVEMVAPVPFKASLREDAYEVDPDTKNPRVRSAYLGLSASGEVTAPLVYAHSGNPEDYQLLRGRGIDVRGKVVIVRYSNPYSYRGFKALTAEREGAAALIIYSDPAEDGDQRGKVYPDGPWGPASHIQRGAITYDFIVPGDPLTPGWASLPEAKRIDMKEARSVPKIIAVPMSWRDAKPLLENMNGADAPRDWQGGLPIKYRLSGAVRVHVKADMDTSVMPNYVVEARIKGAEFPDEWIVMGNHRDAWEFGGVDPSSGTASMLEMTRAFGELKRQGARPRRTLVVCSWDGEEVALTGSTEWGEQFADELQRKAIAYLNVDSSASGPNFQPSAVASLAPLLVDMSRGVRAPSGKSLYEEWRAAARESKKSNISDAQLVDVHIGSGSDHTVFLNHLGVPVIGLEFDGPYGVYHSMYDDYYWMNRFGDPGYRYHTLMSVVWGTLGLRLANADLLPFDFAAYGHSLGEFVAELQGKPGVKERLDLQAILRRTGEFTTAGIALNRAMQSALAAGKLDAKTAARVNQSIRQVELNWLNPNGIPNRPWFKHMLYAARYTYAHLELPGLTEAIEAGNWMVAAEQARLLDAALAKNIALLRQTHDELSKAK